MRKRTVRRAAGALALAALLAGCSAESITQAQATEIALEHAGVTQEEASSLSVQQDTTEEGRKVYEIDFPPRTPSIITTWPGTMGDHQLSLRYGQRRFFQGSPGG